MKRLLMLLAVLSIGYVAGAALPGVILAQGGQAREGGANPNAGRGQAPGGRFTDNPRAARNMFLVTAGPETRAQPGKAKLYNRVPEHSEDPFRVGAGVSTHRHDSSWRAGRTRAHHR